MSSAQGWGMHGCYNPAIGNSKYYEWPIEAGLHGCQDEWVNLDHRDPSHPVRNFVKRTHEMRENYPVFQDGFSLQLLSNRTYQYFYQEATTLRQRPDFGVSSAQVMMPFSRTSLRLLGWYTPTKIIQQTIASIAPMREVRSLRLSAVGLRSKTRISHLMNIL